MWCLMNASRLYFSPDFRRIKALAAILGSLVLSSSHLPGQEQSAPVAPAAVKEPAPPKVVDQESFSVIGVSIRTSGEKEAGGNGEIPALLTRAMQDGTLERIPNRADDKILAVYTDFASNRKGEYT